LCLLYASLFYPFPEGGVRAVKGLDEEANNADNANDAKKANKANNEIFPDAKINNLANIRRLE